MGYFKRLKTSGSVSLEAFKMYYVMRASAPSLHRESTDSLIMITFSDMAITRPRIPESTIFTLILTPYLYIGG